MEPTETGLDWYLCRVCDIVPVGRWKLKLPSQDLVEEIFLQIVLTVSDKDMEEEPKSPDRFLTKRSWEEWGEESILFGLGSSCRHCIFSFYSINGLKNISIGLGIRLREGGGQRRRKRDRRQRLEKFVEWVQSFSVGR